MRIKSWLVVGVALMLGAAVWAVAQDKKEECEDCKGCKPLFNGKDLTGWKLRHEGGRNGWKVENGVLINIPPSTDLVTEEKFKDFELCYEYMVPKGSNSGVYLRGRYEIQILDDYGRPPSSGGNGGVYGQITPVKNASKPAGEWQKVKATLIGRKLTVVLNGEKIIDNAELKGVTGGALDNKEDEPGPILLQGDHGVVHFRNIRINPTPGKC